MKRINQDELYQNLGAFLTKKGIELKEGTYTQRIQKGCRLLTDAINLAQEAVEKAKVKTDKKLEQMRQTIHEKTAPKARPAVPPVGPSAATSAPPPPPAPLASLAQNPPPPTDRTAPRTRPRKRSTKAKKPSKARPPARK